MKPSRMVLNPVGGSRAEFRIPASASVSVGEVVALRKEDENDRRGMIALVTSARLTSNGEGDATIGTLDVLATYRGVAVEPAPTHLAYGTYWCEHPLEELLTQYYGKVPMIRTSKAADVEPLLRVGTLRQQSTVPVSFSAPGFGRHTVMFAQSGSGKSYSLGVILEELIANTTGRLVVIDPNGDFTEMDKFAVDAKWTPAQKERYQAEMQKIKTFTPTSLVEAEIRIDEVIADQHRGAIFNLNGVEVLLWQKIVWVILKRLWRSRDKRVPTLIFIDESHNFAPADTKADDDSPLKELGRIAAEGRKYGLWLVLATQRPQKLEGNIISQCDNLIVMKLTSRADTDYIAQGYNGVTREMVELAYGFTQGEAIAVGRFVKSPTLFRFRLRNTREGGADLAPDWATPRQPPLQA